MSTVKLGVKHAEVVMRWDINSTTQDCMLCKKKLLSPSPQELTFNEKTSKLKITGKLIEGECQHLFHKECIDGVLNTGSISCPICKTPWKTKNTLQTGFLCEMEDKLTLKK